jgi:branched-chain amino acid transport system ATP-binding protein
VEENIRNGLVYCPQGGEVFRSLSVEDNLRMGGFHVLEPKALRESAEKVFDLFPILFERKRQLAGNLSGGERQMLAIAMSLMSLPRLLLLDEPSGGLAPFLVERVFASITEINRRLRLPVLLVEQNVKQALAIATRFWVLRSGEVVFTGDPAEFAGHGDAQRAVLGF